MGVPDREKLRELWKDFFFHLYDAGSYSELLFCSLLSKSKVYVGEKTALHNVEILTKYNYFFRTLEYSAGYATVLSITQLFEDGQSKKQRTLAYLLAEAKKFKIDRYNEYGELREKHKKTLTLLKESRDTYFAHRDKSLVEGKIPSRNDVRELLSDIAKLLNSIGKDFEGGGDTFLWGKEEGWSKHVREDFQKVLDNLHRGEAVRLSEIQVKYGRKLYHDNSLDEK